MVCPLLLPDGLEEKVGGYKDVGQQPVAAGLDRGAQDARWRCCADVGPAVRFAGNVSGLRHAVDILPQPARSHALGNARQWERGPASAIDTTFRCGHASCRRQTLSEPLAPAFGRRYGRWVGRCNALVCAVTIALDGRLMVRLAVPWSRDTMLRVLRRGDPLTEPPPPARVIGIDDFSWRRGDSDGGIVVDLEVVRSSTC